MGVRRSRLGHGETRVSGRKRVVILRRALSALFLGHEFAHTPFATGYSVSEPPLQFIASVDPIAPVLNGLFCFLVDLNTFQLR